jgi:quinol monooxygenase YgiN
MLVRIVKMSFHNADIEIFLENFNANKQRIREFEGCSFLELYRDRQQSHIFFTYSFWATAADLERYRKSELFKAVWSKTKPLFNDEPEAWSVDKYYTLD